MDRLIESQRLLKEAFMYGLGSYMEQESKKEDIWRDQTWTQLFLHLHHEVAKELRDSKGLRMQLHNAVDAMMLSAMMVAKCLLEAGVLEDEG